MYQLAAAAGGFDRALGAPATEPGGASLVQLGTSAKSVRVQPQDPLGEDEDPQWAAQLLARTADGMAGASFEAVVGTHCGFCPVASSCPAQDTGRSVCDEVGR